MQYATPSFPLNQTDLACSGTQSAANPVNIAKLPILESQTTQNIADVTVNNVSACVRVHARVHACNVLVHMDTKQLTPTCERSANWRSEVIMNFDESISRSAGDCTMGRTNPTSFIPRKYFGYTGYTTVLQAIATFKRGGRYGLRVAL